MGIWRSGWDLRLVMGIWGSWWESEASDGNLRVVMGIWGVGIWGSWLESEARDGNHRVMVGIWGSWWESHARDGSWRYNRLGDTVCFCLGRSVVTPALLPTVTAAPLTKINDPAPPTPPLTPPLTPSVTPPLTPPVIPPLTSPLTSPLIPPLTPPLTPQLNIKSYIYNCVKSNLVVVYRVEYISICLQHAGGNYLIITGLMDRHH